jgi:hypothetical protein
MVAAFLSHTIYLDFSFVSSGVKKFHYTNFDLWSARITYSPLHLKKPPLLFHLFIAEIV